MSARHFCTYFDHRYLAQGLALHASLQRNSPNSTLWVLCLSDECEIFLRGASLPGMRLLSLPVLEHDDPELASARFNRSLVEYYFTCSPCLPRYLLHMYPGIDAVTYLDADLYFFSSVEPVFVEIGETQIAITPHRYPARMEAGLLQYGRFNVGWLTFRRGEHALACLDWWRKSCIEWCYDRVEPGRFGDQKYLDRFGELFPSVHIISNIGVNLAPWNVLDAVIRMRDSVVTIDGTPLVFFHFHGLKKISQDTYDTNLDDYGARLTPELRQLVYRPYINELRNGGATDADSMVHLRSRQTSWRNPAAVLGRVLASARAHLRGSIIHC
jgi:hypothetical protein